MSKTKKVKKGKKGDKVTCLKCEGTGTITHTTGRCLGCHMDKDDGIGCCVRKVKKDCVLCGGKGVAKMKKHTCGKCSKKEYWPAYADMYWHAGWRSFRSTVNGKHYESSEWCKSCARSYQ